MNQGSIVRDKIPEHCINAQIVPVLAQADESILRPKIADRIALITVIFKSKLGLDDKRTDADVARLELLADVHSMIVALIEFEGLEIDDLRTLDQIIPGDSVVLAGRIMQLSTQFLEESDRQTRISRIGEMYSLVLGLTQNEGLSLRDLEMLSSFIREDHGGFKDRLILLDAISPQKIDEA